MFRTLILPILLATLTTSNDLVIYNFCGRPVYTWHQRHSINALPPLQSDAHIKMALSPDPQSGGANIILSFDPKGIDNSAAPKIQLSYQAVHPDEDYELWYALSNLKGKMLEGRMLDMGVVGEPRCERLEWKGGVGDERVKVCKRFKYSNLRLCTETLVGKEMG